MGIGWYKCCVLLLFGDGVHVGLMIGSGVILRHSLKLGIRRWLVIIEGLAQGSCVAKVMTRVLAGRHSMFSENHIQQRVRVVSGQKENMLIRF